MIQWNIISYLADPIVFPFFSIANLAAGMLIVSFFVIVPIFFSNVSLSESSRWQIIPFANQACLEGLEHGIFQYQLLGRIRQHRWLVQCHQNPQPRLHAERHRVRGVQPPVPLCLLRHPLHGVLRGLSRLYHARVTIQLEGSGRWLEVSQEQLRHGPWAMVQELARTIYRRPQSSHE